MAKIAIEKRTHRKQVEAQHLAQRLSPEAISANKNARCKARNEARRAERDAVTASRPKLSPAAQLKNLDLRLGVGVGAKKERRRLTKLIGE